MVDASLTAGTENYIQLPICWPFDKISARQLLQPFSTSLCTQKYNGMTKFLSNIKGKPKSIQRGSTTNSVVTQGQQSVIPMWLHKVSTTSVVTQGQYHPCGYIRSVLPVQLHKVSTTSVVTQGQYYQCGYTGSVLLVWLHKVFVDLFVVCRGFLGHLCRFATVKGIVTSDRCSLIQFLIFFYLGW